MDKNIDFLRARYERGNNYYSRFGINAQTAQLRIEVPFIKGKGSLDFDLRKEVKRSTEKTLKRNDLFIASHIGIATMVELDAMPGHSPLLTYPMLQSLSLPTGVKGFANTHVDVLWNGVLTMKTGQQVNYSGMPLDKFRVVPATQPIAAIKTTDGSILPSGAMSSINHSDFMQLLPEELRFAGTQDHTIRVEFPATADTDIKGDAGTTSFAVLLIDGWLFEGGTSEKFKNDNQNPYQAAI
jgi:hypothetical protein